MVRPKASSYSIEIATAFALSVTAPSCNQNDMVARQGQHSIFMMLMRIAPKVFCSLYNFWGNPNCGKLSSFLSIQICRTRESLTTCRHGISMTEFNKLLERRGFVRIRNRLAKAWR